uniref:TOG domain-containing protein n=1 Tax=Wuchereria bancrofti TaxID=6293 RepID=A0A1I8EVG8_WUCBA
MLAPIVTDRSTPLLPSDEDIIELLRSTDFDVRLQTLSRLTVWLKHDPQWFSKFVKKGDLFKQLERLLMDDRWEVQHQCIKFLHDALPTFGDKVVGNFLLNNENDVQIKDEALREIPNLMIIECVNQNWKFLISSLVEMLHTISSERCEKIILYLGTEKLRKILSELSTKQYEIWKKYEQIIFETSDTMKESVVNKEKMLSSVDVELRYRFGIIPMSTSNMLNNETDTTSRIAALEQVNVIINGITPEDTRKFAAHLHSYFLTLGNVLDDLNFKVVQIVGLISKHFGSQKSAIRQQIMAICMITMRNCSPKSVISYLCVYSEHRNPRIREEVFIIFFCKKTLSVIHLSSQTFAYLLFQILNIMTSALLTFDSRSINLKAIADVVVPLLADQKRRVRLAAFELFAVFAHLSSNSTKRLLKSVSNLEEKHHAYGLLNAVKERISRNTLPKIRSDGLIEYVTPLDADISASNREGWRWLKTNNLDYEWIMGGGNGSSSPLHSVERIRLQKLHLDGDLHQIAHNDSSMSGAVASCAAISARSVTGKEPSEEILIGNGFDKIKQYNSDGNFLPNNVSRNRKITNPDDLPIKPSKWETYCNSYAPSEPAIPTRSFLSLVRKSFSHQNLACTSKTTGISQRIQASPKVIRKNNLKSASSMRSITSNSSSVTSMSKREKRVQNIEMNGKLYAIEVIDTLAKISPGVLAGNIHPVVTKLLNECKNLRSTVSRAAISSFGALFENLKTVMDSDIEKVCSVLMQKAGDVSNAFIRDDATVALEKMIKYVSPGRSLYALVSSGAKSKSNTIRACCASLLVKLVERLGPVNAIGSVEFPRFVTSLLLFARDANVTVRQTGKYGIRLLSQSNDLFDDAVRKSLNESERQNLNEVLDAINRRGLEETSLASSSLSLGSISRSGSMRRSGSNGRDAPISQSIQQDLLQVRNNLIASEWERRMKGLKEFSQIVMRNDRAAISDTKVLGAFVGRTSDINFKLINSLMSHLASRSEGHRQHARLCFEEITKYIENMALLAPFASATKQANVKQKPFMLQTLSKLIESVYSIKPRQAEAVGLPVLWELLRTPPRNCSDPEVRDAIRRYAITMARCVSIKTLLELSTFRISPSQKKTLQELIS